MVYYISLFIVSILHNVFHIVLSPNRTQNCSFLREQGIAANRTIAVTLRATWTTGGDFP